MKITSVEIYLLDGGRPSWRPIVCRVNTDEGLYGYGKAAVAFNSGVGIFSAISALDTAFWDIRGKALGVPVWKLLGGQVNKSLRAYASQLQFGWGNGMAFDKGARAEDLAESAVSAAQLAHLLEPYHIMFVEEPNTPLLHVTVQPVI